MKTASLFLTFILAACMASCAGGSGDANPEIGLTLIPPDVITDKVDLDVRAGVLNKKGGGADCLVRLYLDGLEESDLLHEETFSLSEDESRCVRHAMDTEGFSGNHEIIMQVITSGDTSCVRKGIRILDSDIRSTKMLGGAWAGIYHWSETEGKHWNQDIKRMTDDDWRAMVRSMHSLGLNIIVIQEVFRNEEYVGKHSMTVESYPGKAFYPSELYPGRMEITAEDPIEAIMSEADSLGMYVLPGIGMFAWFDFSEESLKWHKMVAEEVWKRYGHHDSFYGFYVSEESGGSLDNWERTEDMRQKRKQEIVTFFREFKSFCNAMAPSKPVMLATNSFGVPGGLDTYPALLENLDILCPFGFARMPEGDLTGKEVAETLQKLCDSAGSHLWFDLESFLFNEDSSLYPRDIEGIIRDLTFLDNFEKVLCYQFPGVFSDPDARIRVGEEKTEKLFNDYKEYLNGIENNDCNE